MKLNRNIALFFTLTAFTFTTAAADEPWFDLEKCGFCKALASQPGLLEHMKTEYHDTKTGIISVTYIDKEYEGAFAKGQAGIRQVVADKMAGKPVVACRHCAAIGEFYQMGLMPESIKSEKCIIVIYSSTEPATVTKLQEFGKKSNEALAEIAKKKQLADAKK
ncbi:MAG: hypothetical protein C5B50_06780 [Verrucomicrobia bacterium]|nr:MAG: hypothetical protein C5B50_06780 [Verrucomicrobiota bacterium]